MQYHYHITPYTLRFRQPAGTSRGIYHKRDIRLITLSHSTRPDRKGMGECAPLPDLSCDPINDTYDRVLQEACLHFCHTGTIDHQSLTSYPSIRFGLEMAQKQLDSTHPHRLFDTAFSRHQSGIPINGLIWMDSFEGMQRQIEDKLAAGFRCIKLKIGAIDFTEEFTLLQRLRSRYPHDVLELRVDANGAFTTADLQHKLELLASLHLHSIEQPIAAGSWPLMADVCAHSPLPIALDEELIGINRHEDKLRLLQTIKPHYIVLKPSLHGGMQGCEEWIALARQMGIDHWVTSALESNIGLNAIAQWTAHVHRDTFARPQGLGTGALYTNNFATPLYLRADELFCDDRL